MARQQLPAGLQKLVVAHRSTGPAPPAWPGCARPQGAASQSVMCLVVAFVAILPGLPHYLIVAACTDGFLRLSFPREHQLLAKLRKHQKLTESPALRWAFWPVAPAATGPYPAPVVRHRLAQQLYQVASNLPGPRSRGARQRLFGKGKPAAAATSEPTNFPNLQQPRDSLNAQPGQALHPDKPLPGLLQLLVGGPGSERLGLQPLEDRRGNVHVPKQ